jgi:hypothetical protein
MRKKVRKCEAVIEKSSMPVGGSSDSAGNNSFNDILSNVQNYQLMNNYKKGEMGRDEFLLRFLNHFGWMV